MKHIADAFGDDPEEAGAAGPAELKVTGPIWLWKSDAAPAAWYFLQISRADADKVRAVAGGRRNGFGSIRVEARIGATQWKTSLFPHKESGGYLLPLKADVRKKEKLVPDMIAEASLLV